MDFNLSDKQLEIQKFIKDFCTKYVAEGVVERDENKEFPMELYKKLAEHNMFSLQYDKKYGGQGSDYTSYALVIQELAKVDATLAATYSVSNTLFLGGINSHGTEEQKKKYISAIASGEAIGCFALTEPEAGSDASYLQTTAKKDGDYYILNGEKCFITNGSIATHAVVFAKTNTEVSGTKGISAFIVDTSTEGFEVGKLENKMGLKSLEVAELFFKDCKVPAENLLGKEGEGFKIAMQILNAGRAGIAAQALGIAKGAYEIALNHLKEREQFGKKLIKNQYLLFKMVDYKLIIEQAELMLMKALYEQDNHLNFGLSAAKAKLLCSDAAMNVTTNMVQMHGGHGYMKEYHLERMMRDAKITQIYEGTNEIQRLVIASEIK